MIKTVKVTLWGEFVGALAQNDRLPTTTFEYDPKWSAKGVEIAPVRMPVSIPRQTFAGLNYATYKGLPAAFAGHADEGVPKRPRRRSVSPPE